MSSERHWLRPPTISAPDPYDREKTVQYEISKQFIECNAAVFRRSPVFQVWAHIVGELPPINNISRLNRNDVRPTLTTLADSVACFRGVKRPYDDEKDGNSVLVYVLNPTVTIDYEPDMVCLAKAVTVPLNTALTVQVKPTKSLQNVSSTLDVVGLTQSSGTVTRLEFVSGNGETPILPYQHADRYLERLWQTK
jgi:hypothetical protein